MTDAEKAKLWDQVVELTGNKHMSSMLLGQFVRDLVRKNGR